MNFQPLPVDNISRHRFKSGHRDDRNGYIVYALGEILSCRNQLNSPHLQSKLTEYGINFEQVAAADCLRLITRGNLDTEEGNVA